MALFHPGVVFLLVTALCFFLSFFSFSLSFPHFDPISLGLSLSSLVGACVGVISALGVVPAPAHASCLGGGRGLFWHTLVARQQKTVEHKGKGRLSFNGSTCFCRMPSWPGSGCFHLWLPVSPHCSVPRLFALFPRSQLLTGRQSLLFSRCLHCTTRCSSSPLCGGDFHRMLCLAFPFFQGWAKTTCMCPETPLAATGSTTLIPVPRPWPMEKTKKRSKAAGT